MLRLNYNCVIVKEIGNDDMKWIQEPHCNTGASHTGKSTELIIYSCSTLGNRTETGTCRTVYVFIRKQNVMLAHNHCLIL
jgi:hypothetical protein